MLHERLRAQRRQVRATWLRQGADELQDAYDATSDHPCSTERQEAPPARRPQSQRVRKVVDLGAVRVVHDLDLITLGHQRRSFLAVSSESTPARCAAEGVVDVVDGTSAALATASVADVPLVDLLDAAVGARPSLHPAVALDGVEGAGDAAQREHQADK